MTRTLVTGATGILGRGVRPRLADAGYTVRGASRSPPGGAADEWVELALPDGPSLDEAVEDVDVIVHAASDPRGDSEAVDVRGTERLLAAAAAADVDHFCYVSIVGIDGIPYSYYQHKLAAERAVEDSAVPSTIVRLTQFHEFVDTLLGAVARLPVWPLPTDFRIQPIAAAEAADAVVARATAEPAGRVPDTGGPEVLSVRELATAYRRARGYRRPIVRLPLPGSTAGSFRSGDATCPDRAVGTVTWESWLADAYE
jgi:uncharacterized protein YbjT (DUF2867 family)